MNDTHNTETTATASASVSETVETEVLSTPIDASTGLVTDATPVQIFTIPEESATLATPATSDLSEATPVTGSDSAA